MRQFSSDDVRRRFEREAESFNAIYGSEHSRIGHWLNAICRKAIFDRYRITFSESDDVTNKVILDVGCGSGIYCVGFAQRGAKRVVGIDFSKNMIRLARQNVRRCGIAEKCEFVEEDFMRMQFDERFNISIAMGVFDYLADPIPFLSKMVSITDDEVFVSFPGHSSFREPLRKLRYRILGKGGVFFYSEERVQRIALEAGIMERRVIRLHSSGGGYVLIGKCY